MTHCTKNLILIMTAFLAVVSCGKKPPAASTYTTPAGTTAATASVPTPAAAGNPIEVQNVNQSLNEVDAALKAKAYDKAVQTLLAVQQKAALSEQQSQEAANRMRGLQANLAAAIAAGDPNAKAAAERLRQAHMVH
jgi:hypothetical protein